MTGVAKTCPTAVFWAPADARGHTALSVAERERGDGYRSRLARAEFVTGASLVRGIASRVLGVRAEDVEVDRSAVSSGGLPGPPRLVGPPRLIGAPWLHLTVTHSAGVVGVAVAAQARIGLDVEEVGAAPGDAELERLCTRAERDLVAANSGETAARRFTRLWCRKESLVKAYGVGLTIPAVSVAVHGSRPHIDDAWLGDARPFGDDDPSTGAWLPIGGPGPSFEAALFAADDAWLVGEYSVDDGGQSLSSTALDEVFTALRSSAPTAR